MSVDHLLGVLNLLAVIFGLAFAGFQILQGRKALEYSAKTHNADHEWHRKIAAQEALAQYSSSVALSSLEKHFRYLEIGKKGCIEREVINKKLASVPDLRQDLHKLLNYYESLARGVHLGLYDDEVIRIGRRGSMERAFKAFECYILDRRESGSPRAWCEFEKLITKWQGADEGTAQV